MNVLIWFKRDLRLEDHPALALAAGMGRVLPAYIVEPDHWALPDSSARQWGFVAECLADLRGALAQRGLPLAVRVGAAVAVLEKLCRAHGIGRIVSHQEVGNLWTRTRDRQVAVWARAAGIEWLELPQSGVMRPSAGSAAWPGLRAGFMAAEPAVPGAMAAVPGVEPGGIPTARALRLAEDRCAHAQAGGRARGLLVLESFLARRGEGYRRAGAAAVTGERASSRLSPYLAQGALSLREVVQATAARQAERPGGGWGGSLRHFQSRLAQRDQSLQQLEEAPQIEWQALQPGRDARRESDAARLAAWERGETGLPYLDACMRYLAATGWLNFPGRATVIAVASAQLGLDWRASGTVLARRFTDYEPGIHWPQVQLYAGVAQSGRLRLCDPVKAGRIQDPTGAFTRRWVPELATVPDAFLQAPWKWPGAAGVLGRRYPEPVVDLAMAARQARQAVASLPCDGDTRRILRDAARRKPVAGQLCLDL